ncbi:MAG: hypothetical protein ABSA70_04305 [Terriglobia bacterium]
MFRRFASASAIASMGIALAVLVVLITHGLAEQRFFPLVVMWCFAPLAWGLWAMIAPSAWVPGRLPVWGMILGLVAGLAALFVLNLPWRIFGVAAPLVWRGAGVVVIAGFYYLLWMLVRVAYRSLGGPTRTA